MSIPRAGTAVVAVSANATPSHYTAISSGRTPVTPGNTMTAAATVWSLPGTVPGATVRVMIRYYDAPSGGAVVSESYTSAPTSTEGQRLVHQAVVPPDAVSCAVALWYVNVATPLPASSGPWSWWDAVTLDAIATDGSWLADGAPPAVSNRIYRDGQLIGAGLPVDPTFTDPLPLTTGSTYRVEAVSALPSTGASEITMDAHPDVLRRFWLNAGAGWTLVAKVWGNINRTRRRSRAREVEHYAGRDLPVLTLGEGIDSATTLAGTLILDEDAVEDFDAVALTPTVACYRDPSGRYFVSIDEVGDTQTRDDLAQVSVSMTTVDYTDTITGGAP